MKICVSPFDEKDIKVCDRPDDPCCMCLDYVAVSESDIKKCIDLLCKDGCNSKEHVKEELQKWIGES